MSGDEAKAIAETLELFQILGDKNIDDEYRGAYIKLINSLTLNKTIGYDKIPFVVSQQAPQQWGFFHYKPLLEFIKKKQVLTFTFVNDNNVNINLTIHPYQLLEFNHKWFLLGYSRVDKTIRVIGFDRIMPDFKIESDIKFDDSKISHIMKYTEDMFGVCPLENEKIQTIEFYVSNKYKYLLERHPLHQSQKIFKQSHELITKVTIRVIPTHELIQWFLSHCENVLVDSIKIKNILKQIVKFRFEENKIILS